MAMQNWTDAQQAQLVALQTARDAAVTAASSAICQMVQQTPADPSFEPIITAWLTANAQLTFDTLNAFYVATPPLPGVAES